MIDCELRVAQIDPRRSLTADCGKRVLLGIYFYNYLDNYFSVFVPEQSRPGTNPLSDRAGTKTEK